MDAKLEALEDRFDGKLRSASLEIERLQKQLSIYKTNYDILVKQHEVDRKALSETQATLDIVTHELSEEPTSGRHRGAGKRTSDAFDFQPSAQQTAEAK